MAHYHLPIHEEEYGITTGSAATGAALAALLSIKKDVKVVKIQTPITQLDIEVESSQKLTETSGRASVIKRPYNDPDVTRNLEFFADLTLKKEQGITVEGGEGVGRVTKPGLQVPVGEAAINPVPRDMIQSNLQRVLESEFPGYNGAEVIISVPDGRETAKRTMNPRLGIVDGISILGTTGIARSMSVESYRKSFKCQMDVSLAEGYDELIFVPGNIGEKLAMKLLDVHEDEVVQMSNFVGYMLSEAESAGVNRITLFGHAGKLIKIAAGIFNTKHSVADGRREVIMAHAALQGADCKVVKKIFDSNTTEEMIDVLNEFNMVLPVFNSIADSIKELCSAKYQMDFNVVILRMDGTVLNENHVIRVKSVEDP
ncbi:Cobalt-precorrin-5B C(1)-methyltransferase [anaerobic digester metagenome]